MKEKECNRNCSSCPFLQEEIITSCGMIFYCDLDYETIDLNDINLYEEKVIMNG